MSEHQLDVAIVGGGISGLSAGLLLDKNNSGQANFHIYEKSKRLGGIIETQKQDGFLLEQGPDCFLPKDEAILNLISELGLEKQLIQTQAQYRRSYVLKGKKLVPIPSGFYLLGPKHLGSFLMSPMLGLGGKLRTLGDLVIPRKSKPQDESLSQFVKRRFGTKLLDQLAQPIAAGIYSANPEELSMHACFPQFVELEQQYRSVILGLMRSKQLQVNTQTRGPRYQQFLSLKNGMQSLVDTLASRLSQHVSLNTEVLSLQPFGSGWQLKLSHGGLVKCKQLILALPSHLSQKLLKSELPDLSASMGSAQYGSSAVVNLAYPRDQIKHLPPGMGYVVPHKEGRPIVACSIISHKFEGRTPDADKFVLLRVFLGGSLNTAILEKTDAQLTDLAHQEVSNQFGISSQPILQSLRRWNQRMPQYKVGHLEQMKKFEREQRKHPNLHFLGNGFGALGIPDMVRQSSQLIAKLKGRSTDPYF